MFALRVALRQHILRAVFSHCWREEHNNLVFSYDKEKKKLSAETARALISAVSFSENADSSLRVLCRISFSSFFTLFQSFSLLGLSSFLFDAFFDFDILIKLNQFRNNWKNDSAGKLPHVHGKRYEDDWWDADKGGALVAPLLFWDSKGLWRLRVDCSSTT